MSETNENITRLDLDGKEIILIGTAHVSKAQRGSGERSN